MTFRAKPVVKRAHRPAWEAQDRRNFYLNIGFGLIVVLAIVILGIAAALAYYNDHLASVGSVDGQSITKDDLRERVTMESWRLNESLSRIRTAVLAGHLTEAQATQAESTITQQQNGIASLALERIIDTRLQAKLAAQEGISATPEDIDARLQVEATTQESRHAWMIAVAPVTDTGAIAPTAAQKADAKAKADAALKDIQGGKTWEDVAKTVSTDTATAPQGGDLGWLTADDGQSDEAFLKAVFAAPANTPTAVVEGSDGTFRIGRASEIVASAVDDAYQSKITNSKIDLQRYRAILAGDVIHEKLSAKIVADVIAPGPQRHVQEIYFQTPQVAPAADAIKVRHILYSPKGDPTTAESVAADDPSWEVAHQKAVAAYIRLQADPKLFDSIARSESDEDVAKGPAGNGGKLPYFDSSSQVDDAFLKAILAPGLKAGDLLPPVKSAFGWHVIQVMNRPPDADQMNLLKTQADGGSDFAVLARDSSMGSTSGTGGDIGWIAKGQLDDKLTAAIFAAQVGKTSDVVTVDGDGVYLFKVLAEETRTPEGRQAHRSQVDRLLEVVQREEIGGHHHARSFGFDAKPVGRGRVLDALVAEARLRWGFDPAVGLQVFASESLIAAPIEPSRPLLIVPLSTLRATVHDERPGPLPGRAGHGDEPLALLRRLYPSGHPVGLVGRPDGTTVGTLDASALEAPIYLSPTVPEAAVAGPWAMPWISARLRAPDGCPWDREQTHTSLRKHLLEEAYEVYDALEAGATPELAGELGDLWLQIVLHAQLAAEAGVFDLADVQAAIASKIVRRHPHVFGDAVARTASDVNRQWERIKADERAAAARVAAGEDVDGRPAPAPARGALEGISPSMPALAASQEMQERAANLGYDWPSIDGVLDKVAEEADELRRAANDAERAEEFGDLMFVLVNVARRRGIEAEAAVRAANAKFRRRFGSVERAAAGQGVALRDLDFAALDALWDAAKAEEKTR